MVKIYFNDVTSVSSVPLKIHLLFCPFAQIPLLLLQAFKLLLYVYPVITIPLCLFYWARKTLLYYSSLLFLLSRACYP